MNKERLVQFAVFDPEKMAKGETETAEMEIRGDIQGKFMSEVGFIQMFYNISEAAAYKLNTISHEGSSKDLTDDEKRNMLVKFYQVLKDATKLGFDPYEAALANEKLKIASKGDDDKKTAKELANLYGVIYSKDPADFQVACKQRIKSINAYRTSLSLALWSSHTYLLNEDVDSVRTELGRNWNSVEPERESLKFWKLFKEAILK